MRFKKQCSDCVWTGPKFSTMDNERGREQNVHNHVRFSDFN